MQMLGARGRRRAAVGLVSSAFGRRAAPRDDYDQSSGAAGGKEDSTRHSVHDQEANWAQKRRGYGGSYRERQDTLSPGQGDLPALEALGCDSAVLLAKRLGREVLDGPTAAAR